MKSHIVAMLLAAGMLFLSGWGAGKSSGRGKYTGVPLSYKDLRSDKVYRVGPSVKVAENDLLVPFQVVNEGEVWRVVRMGMGDEVKPGVYVYTLNGFVPYPPPVTNTTVTNAASSSQ